MSDPRVTSTQQMFWATIVDRREYKKSNNRPCYDSMLREEIYHFTIFLKAIDVLIKRVFVSRILTRVDTKLVCTLTCCMQGRVIVLSHSTRVEMLWAMYMKIQEPRVLCAYVYV
jgi:hypothetical protein